VKGLLVEAVARSRAVQLHDERLDRRRLQRRTRAREHLRLEPFDIDLDQRRRGARSELVDSRHVDVDRRSGRLARSDHVIDRVERPRENELPRLRRDADVHGADARLEAVHANVRFEATERRRHRFHSDARRAATRREQRVDADVRAHVQEAISRAQRVHDERHVRELGEPDVHIPGGARPSWLHEHHEIVDERHDDGASKQARPDLPAKPASERFATTPRRERMLPDELRRVSERAELRDSREHDAF
jgi:hypothetical protein